MNNLNFPLFITWSITSKCNLRCKHCFRKEYDCNVLKRKDIDKFINLFIEKKVNRIFLTGGEPLTSNNLFYIAKKLMGKIKLGIATNGTLLTDEIISELNCYNVKDFQISLDGATEYFNDFIRGKGVYKKVIENVKKLKLFDCNVTIAMTVNSFNFDDIMNNSIKLIKKLGLKKLRLEFYVPVNKNGEIKAISVEKMEYLINYLRNEDIIIESPKFDDKYGCGAGIYNCVLNSDMTISPCDLLTDIYRTSPIVDIDLFQKFWLGDPVFVAWRKKMKCLDCNKKFKCIAMEEK